MINTTKKWGAKVVYGDTDSLFIYLPGKTKDQAFRIGQDMADSITQLNPAPIKLKFEKVGNKFDSTLCAMCSHGVGLPALRLDGEEAIRWIQVREP